MTLISLYVCGLYYGATSYEDDVLRVEYKKIWDATDTTIYKQENGVFYGETATENLGPGFVSYCSSKGVNINYRYIEDPAISDFKSYVNNDNMSIFCGYANIEQSDGSSKVVGHGVTVEGYIDLTNKSNSSKVTILVVFDGWNEYVRYINPSAGWSSIEGVGFIG